MGESCKKALPVSDGRPSDCSESWVCCHEGAAQAQSELMHTTADLPAAERAASVPLEMAGRAAGLTALTAHSTLLRQVSHQNCSGSSRLEQNNSKEPLIGTRNAAALCSAVHTAFHTSKVTHSSISQRFVFNKVRFFLEDAQ